MLSSRIEATTDKFCGSEDEKMTQNKIYIVHRKIKKHGYVKGITWHSRLTSWYGTRTRSPESSFGRDLAHSLNSLEKVVEHRDSQVREYWSAGSSQAGVVDEQSPFRLKEPGVRRRYDNGGPNVEN